MSEAMQEQVLAVVGTDWTDWRELGDADLIHCAVHMVDRGELEESRQMLYRDNGHPCGCAVWFRRNDPSMTRVGS